MFNKEPWY